MVNKLRRYLMLVAQQWDAFLAKQGSLQIAPPQPTPGEEQQGREQALAPLYARSDSVGSSASGSVALGRVSAPMAEAQSRPVPPGGLSGYLAPKLVDTGYDSPTEASSKGDLIIPTGLVAKYVAMFEDPVLSSKDSGAHVHLSGPEESGDAKFNFLSRPSTTIDLRHTSLDDVAVQMMSPRSTWQPSLAVMSHRPAIRLLLHSSFDSQAVRSQNTLMRSWSSSPISCKD